MYISVLVEFHSLLLMKKGFKKRLRPIPFTSKYKGMYPQGIFIFFFCLWAYADFAQQFVDSTRDANIDFIHISGRSPQKYFIETMGSGSVFFDYNNDDFQDLYIVNIGSVPDALEVNTEVIVQRSATNALYRNNGDGTFTDVTERAGVGNTGYGMGTAAADYDNDGDQDLYVVNYGPNVLYVNNGDGTFTNQSDQAGVDNDRWGIACTFLDFDLDGDLDLYVVNYLAYNFSMPPLMREGLVGYSSPHLFSGTRDVLYQNNSDGTFTDVTDSAGVSNPEEGKGMGVVAGDFDNDGWPDVYVTNDTCRNFLYHNNGNGTFTDLSISAGCAFDENGLVKGSMGCDFGDYNNDGWLDIFVVCTEFNTLYRNNGDGTFANETTVANLAEPTQLLVGYSPAFLDYDNDMDLDIFVTNGHFQDIIESLNAVYTYAQQDQLYRNNGDETFSDISFSAGDYFQQRHVGRGLSLADYDNDGDTDLFIVNSNQPSILLENRFEHRNNWLRIKLVGTQSNRDGIHARVRLLIGNQQQIGEVKSGSGYASGSDKRILFGLGQHQKVDQVEIRWPNRLTQKLSNVVANQTITIVETTGGENFDARVQKD